MHSVLFICSANICRSPMAVGLLKVKVKDQLADWRIESAGLWAMSGYTAAENTRLVVEARGENLDDHRSRLVNHQIIGSSNLILTMEYGHKEALRVAFPEFSRRIFTLTEMAGERGDIQDPIGSPLEDFEFTAHEIEHILNKGFKNIYRLSQD